MILPNEFWLHLHRLTESYEAEGATAEERTRNIIAQLQAMPLLARQQLRDDLLRLIVTLPELYRQVAAAAQASKGRQRVGGSTSPPDTPAAVNGTGKVA